MREVSLDMLKETQTHPPCHTFAEGALRGSWSPLIGNSCSTKSVYSLQKARQSRTREGQGHTAVEALTQTR